MVETVPADMVKLAVVALAATVTDAGTVRVGEALLLSVTNAPPDGAAFDNVAVHVVLPLVLRVLVKQVNPEIVAGAVG